jgi:acetyl/propionyl-CoA carboxylase alpha subunit
MLAKLNCFGETREEAIKLWSAIETIYVEGCVQTTLAFWKICFEHEAFVPKFDTILLRNIMLKC